VPPGEQAFLFIAVLYRDDKREYLVTHGDYVSAHELRMATRSGDIV
jgi:hypothetical protein